MFFKNMSVMIYLVLILFLDSTTAIKLTKSGYEDIYIIIEDTVEEDSRLLERIKTEFTEASHLLFQATYNRIYFKNIKVIIPKSWTTHNNYKQQPASSQLTEVIKISNQHDIPHVIRIGGTCGTRGEYMHLPADFMLNEGRTNFGLHENVIVHEWGHLRWGLWDEYPMPWYDIPRFYRENGKGDWKPNGCSLGVTGKIGYGPSCVKDYQCRARSKYNINDLGCYFCPDPDQDSVKASIMSSQYVDALKLFCHDDSEILDLRHNKFAQNMHNKVCRYRSAWDVMSTHSDFREKNPITPPIIFDTTPEFEFIQETEPYRIFVFDTSGSMEGSRIRTLKQTAEYITQEVIRVESWLGIVTFEKTASKIMKLMQIISQDDRDALKNVLPATADGSTCIGCGIDGAIEMLSETLGNANKGEIILISDGENNEGNINISRQNAISSGVVIHTIAISQQADTLLKDIAEETGGRHFTYLETGQVSLLASFAETISHSMTSSATTAIMILAEKIDELSPLVKTFSFNIDKTIGLETRVSVMTNDTTNVQLELNGPNNYRTVLNQTASTFTLYIPDTAEVGEYFVNITLHDSNLSVEYYVLSVPLSSDTITVKAKLSKNVIDYTKGELPILYAAVSTNSRSVINSHVTAIVASDGPPCEYSLADNGQDPDVRLNDGTYSGYIPIECIQQGRISLQVIATGTGGETRLRPIVDLADSSYQENIQTEEMDDSFQRMTIPEDLYIENFDAFLGDVIPPGRITDVALIYADEQPKDDYQYIKLRWTRTGDDMIFGNASDYQIRLSEIFDDLLDTSIFDRPSVVEFTNFTLNHENDQVNAEFMLERTYLTSRTVYIGVRGVDDEGNTGDVSNIVSLTILDMTGDNEQSDEGVNVTIIVVGVVIPSAVVMFGILVVVYLLKEPKQVSDILPTPRITAARDVCNTRFISPSDRMFELEIVDESSQND